MAYLNVLIFGIILGYGASAVTAGNLALRQPANMSDAGDVIAASAVDGDTKKCAVTSPLTDPWWRVDLEMSYIVEEVKIISGRNGITNFEIRIGDSVDNQGNTNQQCGGLHTLTSSQVNSFLCSPGIRGQYVNIRIAGDNKILELCEVTFRSIINVALQKSASQSSQCCYATPDRAVDGNSDGVLNNGHCSHTATFTTDPWWRVDLGSSQLISEVFIVNRVRLQDRLFDIEIRVGDNSDGNVNPRCGGVNTMATLNKASFYCKPRETGRYLNITLLGPDKALTLCEVEVYSESRAFYKTKRIETIDVYEGSAATLHCPEPFGYPEPLAAWVRNDVTLQNSSSDMTLNLTTLVKPRDNEPAIKIDCVVSNIHGSDYHRFILNVKNSCQDPLTCGTQAPGWVRGGHPTVDDNVVTRTVCFSWNDNCCFAELQAHVRRCYGYYVYKLQPTTFEMKARYCTEKSTEEYSTVVFQPFTKTSGKQYALVDHVISKEDHVSASWKCMAYCLAEKTCASFNYYHESGACELNNSTRSRDPDSLKERSGSEYFEKSEGLVIINDVY